MKTSCKVHIILLCVNLLKISHCYIFIGITITRTLSWYNVLDYVILHGHLLALELISEHGMWPEQCGQMTSCKPRPLDRYAKPHYCPTC